MLDERFHSLMPRCRAATGEQAWVSRQMSDELLCRLSSKISRFHGGLHASASGVPSGYAAETGAASCLENARSKGET